MNSVLAVVFLLLLLLSRNLRSNAMKDGKTCPDGQFAQMSPDNTITFFTENTYNYGKNWFRPTSSRLVVWVKACRNAHFMLQTSIASVAYEIVLGAFGNNRTDIRKDRKILNSSFIVGLLRCYQFLPFVIAWNESKIVATIEASKSETVVEWTNPSSNIDVKSISLTGYQLPEKVDDRHFEEYQFKESGVSYLGIKTPGKSPYKTFRRTLYGKDGVSFKLKAYAGATIAFLASSDQDFKQPTYSLTIGAENNTQTKFFYPSNQSHLSIDTPGLLSNGELRECWVAWKDGRFEFGLGSEFYQNSKLILQDLSPFDKIHSMAVDSIHPADWEFGPSDKQGYSCLATCPVGLYPDEKTGSCLQCSMQLANCFSCTQSQSSESPVCTICMNGTMLVGEGGECVAGCPSGLGYTPDYDRRQCVCALGSCCGPVAFRLCIILPCLFGLLLLIPLVLVAIRKVRRLKFIYHDNIDCDQTSMNHNFIPKQVKNIYMENVINPSLHDDIYLPMAPSLTKETEETMYVPIYMATLMTSEPNETTFSREAQSTYENVNNHYINAVQSS